MSLEIYGLAWEQTDKCGGVKPVIEPPIPPLLITGFLSAIIRFASIQNDNMPSQQWMTI